MAESAAQKKKREADEAKVQAAPDLSKFINPDAEVKPAEQVVEQKQVEAESDVVEQTPPSSDDAQVAEVTSDSVSVINPDAESTSSESGNGRYKVIVDSISLGIADVATRGQVIELDEARADRLLGLKAVQAL